MKVLINARVLNERTGGPARYTMNVIRELAQLDSRNEYHLVFYDDIELPFKLPANFKKVVLPLRSRLLFDYCYIPYYTHRQSIDISLFPKNTYSPLCHGKKIPVYHDIIYFEKFDFREFKFFDNLHHKLMIPIAARFSWADLTVSDFTASRMMKLLGIKKEKIVVVKEGVEEHFHKITDPAKLQRVIDKYNLKRPFFFYAGSLSPRKNMLNLIRAMAVVKDKIDHRMYVTGGSSWEDSEVYRHIADAGLSDRIIKLGYVEEDDLVALYNLAACYVYPSLYEGFGLPILEAQACGCPVLTSTVSSCPEVAGSGALLVDPNNVEDIASALVKVSSDTNLRKTLITQGLINARNYSWRSTAEGIYQLILRAAYQ